MTPLPDGVFEAFVIDAEEADDGSITTIEVTIVSGAHRGEVVTVASTDPVSTIAAALSSSFTELIGMPATLEVRDGCPTLRIDS